MKRSTSHSWRNVSAGLLALALVFSSGFFTAASGADLEGSGVEAPAAGGPVEVEEETPGSGDPGEGEV